MISHIVSCVIEWTHPESNWANRLIRPVWSRTYVQYGIDNFKSKFQIRFSNWENRCNVSSYDSRHPPIPLLHTVLGEYSEIHRSDLDCNFVAQTVQCTTQIP